MAGAGGTGGMAGAGGTGGMAGTGGVGGAGGIGGAGGGVVDCTPTSGQPVYVDPSLGVDDAEHGGASEECAVATIDYALTVADADIVLAPPGYSVQTTIELTGAQRLVCDPLRPTTLSGQPSLGTYYATIQLKGVGSGIQDCVIRGDNQNGYCIDVSLTAGDNAIAGNTLSDCGGSAIRFLANGATITDNLINSGSFPNLFFQSAAARATASGNTFVGTPVDNVACGANSLISGTNNVGSQGCDADCNCAPGFFN
jgi:hypothetical protein